MAEQFHFDPDTYLATVHDEVADYEMLQEVVADAAAEVAATAVLDLGTGTGETLRRVAARHPAARVVGVDESEPMLALAHDVVPRAELLVARLQDPLPDGPFDLVVSALAVHHLDPDEKADLFRRVAAVLSPSGRFVLADVIVPDDPADSVIPLDVGYDLPSRVDDQVRWLADAHLRATVRWTSRDLAVVVAERV